MRRSILAGVFLAICPLLLAQQQPPASPADNPSTPAPAATSSTEPVQTDASSNQGARKVVFLDPVVRIEDSTGVVNGLSWLGSGFSGIRNRKPAGTADEYQRVMLDAARSEIGSKAIVVEPDKLDSAAFEVCSNLNTLGSRLSRGNINEEAGKLLAHLAELDSQVVILAQSIHVQIGVSGTWNPNTGGISSSTASTLLQTALISAKTGTVIWKSEQIIRYKAAKPDDSAMSKALLALFKDFKIE